MVGRGGWEPGGGTGSRGRKSAAMASSIAADSEKLFRALLGSVSAEQISRGVPRREKYYQECILNLC